MRQETEVIRGVLEGDIEAFSDLVHRYERPVVRMIRNITADGQYCEDVAQDVFLTAYKKLASFDPARSKFSTWLFTIARNKSLNAIKKKRPLVMAELPEGIERRHPFEGFADREFLEKLDKKLQALPSRQRRAFVMAEFEKLSYQQIAQIEGVRLGTVKSRINRAKSRLRAALKEFGGEPV
ncbi:MAG: RNA polymerase sigma factor [Planctomycetota bacterium]|jgi:RNA polymerase sigma-70 factor (ECF subfamily)